MKVGRGDGGKMMMGRGDGGKMNVGRGRGYGGERERGWW